MAYGDPFSRKYAPEPMRVPEPMPIPGKSQEEAPPQTAPLDTQALERAGCKALGLPCESDLLAGRVKGLHHRLGTLRPREDEVVQQAICDAFRAQAGQYPARAAELWTCLDRELVACLPEEPRCRHTYLVAATGYGKSELLKLLIHSYAKEPDSAAVIVIDPAGEFVDQIAKWPEFVGSNRLVYVHPRLTPGMTPTINPLELPLSLAGDSAESAVHTKQVIAQQLLSAFEEVIAGGQGSQITLNMRAILVPCILTLLDRPGSILLDLQRFMDDERNGDLVAFGLSRTHYRTLPSFFENEFLDKRFAVTKGSIATKLQDLFNTGFFVDLTCGQSTIDLARAIEQRKIILFNLGKGLIGDAESQAFGRLLVALLQGMALRRAELPEHKRVPTHLFIDECHNYVTDSVRTILLEARKYRLYLTLCQQIIGEGMSPGMRDVITGSCNVQLSGYAQPLHQADAARLMQVEPADIARLDRGEFYVRVSRHRAFRFRARADLVGFRHSMAPPSWRRMLARQLRLHYRPTTPESETTASRPDEVVPPQGKSGTFV